VDFSLQLLDIAVNGTAFSLKELLGTTVKVVGK
jgi:hypothetical protein